MSERMAVAHALADTFIHWADKLKVVEDENGLASKTGQAVAVSLKALGMARFRGGEINKTMVLTAQSVREHFDDKVRGSIVQLEREFGRDILSMQYAKLSRMINIVKTRPPQWGRQIAYRMCSPLLYR